MNKIVVAFASIIALVLSFAAQADYPNFSEAKKILRQSVYMDQNREGTFYCGCEWSWAGASGGRINKQSCGYQTRSDANRASRLEWEHIVPASNFGRARQCWQQGGRDNCTKNDPMFAVMEGDLYNLVPSIGEVNGDRSNFAFNAFAKKDNRYGACQIAVDFKNRQVSPPAETRGRIARTYFYMHDRYDLSMSASQAALFMAWHKAYPVTESERLIHDRISKIVGHDNEFVTGKRVWTAKYKNRGDGLYSPLPRVATNTSELENRKTHTSSTQVVRGNRKSQIYHLPEGCPHYDSLSPKNIVEFDNEAAAIKAGFRKAGNCK
ncbi:MAG: endonuclease [Cellvibrio sp.]